MSGKILLRTTGRVLRQLSHDRRTIAMIIVLPLVLLTLVYYLFDKTPIIFDGRNLYDPDVMRQHGFTYFPIGRTPVRARR